MLFKFKDRPGTINSVQFKGLDGNEHKTRIQVDFDLEDEDLRNPEFFLEEERQAIGSLVALSRSRKEEDGPNRYKLGIKRECESGIYNFGTGKSKVTLRAKPVLQPEVRIVEGDPAFRVTLETKSSAKELGKVAGLNGRTLMITAAALQLELLESETA